MFLSFSAILDPKLGKKWSMLVLCVPCTIGWVLMAFAEHSIWLFYIGRSVLNNAPVQG